MNTELLSIPKEKAIAIHKKADQSGRAALIEVFGPTIFITDIAEWEAYIIPRINSFEDACIELGIDPFEARFTIGFPDTVAYERGKIVVKALNGPFSLSWKNGNQQKWHAWMDYTSSGFRLLGVGYDYVITITTSGSRLRLCSEKLAHHFAVKFEPMMRPFMDFDE